MAKKANEGNSANKTSKAKAKAKATVKAKATAKAAKASEVTKVVKSLTRQQVDGIVREIKKLAIDTVERGQMDIGDLVLKKVFQGSLDKATSRNPDKSKSMLQIIADENLRVGRRRLGEWARAAFVRKELMAKKVDCSNLSYSHFAALLKVDDEKNRRSLRRPQMRRSGRHDAYGQSRELKVPAITEGTAQGHVLSSEHDGRQDC